MKKYFKETWYVYAIVFAFCYMLFLYEPLMLYLNNISDFWFGISLMFETTSLLFLIIFAIMVAVFNIIYFLNKDKSKKIFKICAVIMFIVFLCSYIQGNFLVGNLPVLDGTKIVWSHYKFDWVISITLWAVVIGGTIFAIKKLTLNKIIKYSGFVSLAIIVMLSLTLITSSLTTNESFEKAFSPIVTYKNIDNYSKDKNLIIFLLDSADSTTFMERLKKDDAFKDMLNDFTYYPDTMSGHAYTRESIPLILTGQFYLNDTPIVEWSTESYKNSKFFDLLEKNDYELDIYSHMLLYYDSSASRIANVSNNINSLKTSINKLKFYKQEIKYIMFKYLPATLKKYSKVENMNFEPRIIANTESGSTDVSFNPDNYEMIKRIRNDKVEVVDNKIFKFIHLHGAHVPWLYDKNYKKIDNATYDDAVDSSLTVTKEYLNMLKENGVYDNSAIIIMADHGFKTETTGELRHNPIFFVKGMKEKHNSMQISDKSISYVDLEDLYKDLLEGKQTKDVFTNIPKNRERRYLHYTAAKRDIMTEYIATGKAQDKDKMKKTGKLYYKEK